MNRSTDNKIRNIVIVGGGTAGWMTAAALAHKLGSLGVSISLVESNQIGTVGVGEATLPNLRIFNKMLGIDEKEMMAQTSATFKLGIEFCDWGQIGDVYMHPFGHYGAPLQAIDFHQYWVKEKLAGHVTEFGRYCFAIEAAKLNCFRLPEETLSQDVTDFSYAFQFDASLYATYLSKYAGNKGVTRIEGTVVSVQSNPENGFIDSVTLNSGQIIEGDLFIDCTGFRGLLIEGELEAGYEDWSQYLPCNRAIAIACKIKGPAGPYTRATAREAGWQWRIPLQHRIGNGYVYCDSYITDQDVEDKLIETLEGEPLSTSKKLRFKTGKRRKLWRKNCIAIGLSAGFLEPLESTSIDLIQTGIIELIELFPERDCHQIDRDEYNRVMDLEYSRVRDFLMLHYVANQREDSSFWHDMRHMEWPDSLKEKIEAFQTRGLVPEYDQGLFLPASWLSVFIGQNIIPQAFDPRVDKVKTQDIQTHLKGIRNSIADHLKDTKPHMHFIENYGASFQGLVESKS